MMSSKHVCIISLILLGVLVLVPWEAAGVSAQTGSWTEPVNISHTPNHSWFSDLAVDNLGNVHVIWCETTNLEGGGQREQVYYSMWNGQHWSEPNDIAPPSQAIIRNAIAVDHAGNLHALFGGLACSPDMVTCHRRAPAVAAWSARSWSTPRRISGGNSYMADIIVDSKGVIHAIYDQIVGTAKKDVSLADIFYRQSTDGGRTWSRSLNLSNSPTGSARLEMEIDSKDTLYVVWDEGWDRLTGRGEPVYSSYVFSSDGGNSWSKPATVSYPEGKNAQITVAGDGEGGVLVAWRSTSRDNIFYMWSSDNGVSWSGPAAIPGIWAKPWLSPFDMYDMATDSGGHVHLVVAGRVSPEEETVGIYHLEWDGESWMSPRAIYQVGGEPERAEPQYPKIVISQGNQLHVTWGAYDSLVGNMEIWYSRGRSSSPRQTPVPVPTSTPKPTATPLPTATPTATPYPTLEPGRTALPDGLYTENDELFQLLIGVSPILVLVVAILVVRFGWLRRLSR